MLRNTRNYSSQSLEQALKVTQRNIQKENQVLSSQQLLEWEMRLQVKEQNLRKKEVTLKKLGQELKEQSSKLVRQKLEITTKLEKYTEILEELNSHKFQVSNHFGSGLFSTKSQTPCRSLMNFNLQKRNKTSLINCQTRIAELLNTIKQSGQKPQLKSNNSNFTTMNSFNYKSAEYLQQDDISSQQEKDSKLFDMLFCKPAQRSGTEERQSLESRKKTSSAFFQQINPMDEDADIHELKMKSIQLNEQLFYKKINLELNRLKEIQNKQKL